MVIPRCLTSVLVGGLLLAIPAGAATVRGSVSDATGGILPGAHVVLRGVATGQESSVETSADGRFQFDVTALGTYLIIVTRDGFSEASTSSSRRRAVAPSRWG